VVVAAAAADVVLTTGATVGAAVVVGGAVVVSTVVVVVVVLVKAARLDVVVAGAVVTEAVVVSAVVAPVTKLPGQSHRWPVGHGHAPVQVHLMLARSPEGLLCVRVKSMELPLPVGQPVHVWPENNSRLLQFVPKQASTESRVPHPPIFSNIILQYH